MKKLLTVCLLASLMGYLWSTTVLAQGGDDDDSPPTPPPALPRASYLLSSGGGQYTLAVNVLSPEYSPLTVYDNVTYTAVPSWSRSGRLLLFAGKVGQTDDVFVYDSIRNRVTNLTRNAATDIDPVWSPSNKQIAFASDRGKDAGATEIYVMDVNGTNVERLTRSGPQGRAWQPFWSPDSKSLYYFFKANKDAATVIHVFPLSNPLLDREFMPLPENLRSPLVWSPDGKQLAYMYKNRDNIDLMRLKINEDGTAQQPNQVPSIAFFTDVKNIQNERDDLNLKLWQHHFVWTPDGKAIYYDALEQSRYQIFRVEVATGDITNISNAEGQNRMPSISRDGKTLLYVQNRTYEYELIMSNADGSNPVRLTATGADEMSPQWVAVVLQEF